MKAGGGGLDGRDWKKGMTTKRTTFVCFTPFHAMSLVE